MAARPSKGPNKGPNIGRNISPHPKPLQRFASLTAPPTPPHLNLHDTGELLPLDAVCAQGVYFVNDYEERVGPRPSQGLLNNLPLVADADRVVWVGDEDGADLYPGRISPRPGRFPLLNCSPPDNVSNRYADQPEAGEDLHIILERRVVRGRNEDGLPDLASASESIVEDSRSTRAADDVCLANELGASADLKWGNEWREGGMEGPGLMQQT